jgi:uncharacterized cofD-like protein
LEKRTPDTWLKWLTPGIGVKRWLLLMTAGVALLGLGFALALVDVYRAGTLPPAVYVLTLRGLPGALRAGLAGVIGLALIVLAAIRINRVLLAPFTRPGQRLVDAVMDHQHRQRGPKIVAVGGGTGLPTLLRGLKAYTSNLTAIVTVADDGGSSGRLRRDLGVLPPGDFRNNIAALARDEALMTQLFQYRFGAGGLEGHSFGNLFITALSEVTGSFEQALIESSHVLAIRGQVLPSTLQDVTLMADLREDEASSARRVAGESAIPKSVGTIERVFLRPEDVRAYPEAIKAILSADMIVLGPGSLFTSILPNLLVKEIGQAIRASKAGLKVYVCNVATQHGETDNFSVMDHVRAIERHVGAQLFDVVLANDAFPALAPDANFAYVQPDTPASGGPRLHLAPLVDERRPWRHDSDRLASVLLGLLAGAQPAEARQHQDAPDGAALSLPPQASQDRR